MTGFRKIEQICHLKSQKVSWGVRHRDAKQDYKFQQQLALSSAVIDLNINSIYFLFNYSMNNHTIYLNVFSMYISQV